ncbi:MAG TPA: DUF2520 domain-containing protein [Gemmatimonadaceae bacterium]|jgi:predicted short-subunit dehydrogenase-like oxidoreductase (DUF2520 family)|nr:DUF2520 domain-containing protein [Gemmatimonadaceae bacterium]
MPPIAIVGRGRMGSALAAALRAAGEEVRGPLGRGESPADATVVLLCVPDREIGTAAAAIAPGPLVGHVSASAPLDLLAPHERFSLHPLLSVVGAGASFAGAFCAVDASSEAALAAARSIAGRLGMRVKVVPIEQRALYHAAASMASNFLVTLEGGAERLASHVGLEREALVPLVRATLENWARQGARAALTGPIARGDLATAARQRDAVADAAPDLLPLWDALASATRELAVAPATDAA